MTLYNILSICGVGTLCSLLVTFVFNYIVNHGKKSRQKRELEKAALVSRLDKNDADTKLVMQGLQAMLRNKLIELYQVWSVKGYAPVFIKDNFENLYAQYHALGANGVMNDIHDKFLALPDKPRKEQRSKENNKNSEE